MKKKICIVLLIFGLHTAYAQNEIHKKAVEKFILQFNNNDFDGIYDSFSPMMQQSRTKSYFLDFFSNIKKRNGNLLKMELLNYKENKVHTARGIYDGNFETELATVQITVDVRGKITGFYIKRKPLL